MQVLQYFLLASVCLGILYMAYRLIYKKDRNFRQMRTYLLGSVLLSLLFPINSYRIQPSVNLQKPAEKTVLSAENSNRNEVPVFGLMPENNQPERLITRVNWSKLAVYLYFMIALILLARIAIQLTILVLQFAKADKERVDNCVILRNHRFKNTFSFFKWIFVQPGISAPEETKQIIAHEKIHVYQYHSLDLMVIELLSAVMWFNPLVWMMKNSMQLVHEYMADEGALSTGIDRLRYQALLINQVAEERLICLSSSFNDSLIKKRMIMMTTGKINQRAKFKLLALLPISAFLFFLIAIINGLLAEDVKAGSPGSKTMPGKMESSFIPGTINHALPADTVKKVIITKHIKKDNPNDTVVMETEYIDIIDSEEPDVVVRGMQHPGSRDENNRTIVISHSKSDSTDSDKVKYYYHFEDRNENHKTISHDSVTTREIIKHERDGDKIITTTTVIRHNNVAAPSKIFFVIDGAPSEDKNPLSTLDPKEIVSIDVIKDEDIKKYTPGDYDGVIVITTKAGKKK